jgi:two-component system response regulator AtoC
MMATPRREALVIDASPDTRLAAVATLDSLGFQPIGVGSAVDGLVTLYRRLPGLVILSLELPDMTGERVLAQIARTAEQVAVIVVASASGVEQLIASGADPASLIARPVGADEMQRRVGSIAAGLSTGQERVVSQRERDRASFFDRYELIFRHSDAMRAVEQLVITVADTDAPVLIEGESGVGKEQVARAIHYFSHRSARPWTKLSCASIPTDLLESELFGVQAGPEPDSQDGQPGRIETAQGGTLFLDEIGEVSSFAQSQLLRVLQDGEFHTVGARKLTRVDIRMLTATSKNLDTLLSARLFNEDLYHRLSSLRISVPPLRDRRDEIPVLVEYFRDAFARQFGRPSTEISPTILGMLREYSWPGNVRELENMVKRFVVLGEERSLGVEIESRLRTLDTHGRALDGRGVALPPGIGLREIARRAAREAERAAIREVLERVQGNRAAAARLLRISYKTLLHKLDEGGLAKGMTRKIRRVPGKG